MKPLLFAAALLCATPALAETPPDTAADPRVRTLVYQADQVVPLTVAANYQLTVFILLGCRIRGRIWRGRETRC